MLHKQLCARYRCQLAQANMSAILARWQAQWIFLIKYVKEVISARWAGSLFLVYISGTLAPC